MSADLVIPRSVVLSMGMADDATAEQARDHLAALGNADPEVAHGIEDTFAATVLEAIRDGHPDPAGLARAALIVMSAEYPHWSA